MNWVTIAVLHCIRSTLYTTGSKTMKNHNQYNQFDNYFLTHCVEVRNIDFYPKGLRHLKE